MLLGLGAPGGAKAAIDLKSKSKFQKNPDQIPLLPSTKITVISTKRSESTTARIKENMQTQSQITGKNENSNPEIVYDNRFIGTYWIQNSHNN